LGRWQTPTTAREQSIRTLLATWSRAMTPVTGCPFYEH
jgi:hypothetical protein